MISVVISTLDNEELLAHSLAALVPAAAEGIVREVVVVDGGSRDGTLAVADAAGCTIRFAKGSVGARLAEGARQAHRGDWLLFVKPGMVFAHRWEAEAVLFADRAARSGRGAEVAAVFRHGGDGLLGIGVLSRMSGFAGRLAGIPHPHEPLLVPRRLYEASGGHRALNGVEDIDLIRRIGRRRIHRLVAAVHMAVPITPAAAVPAGVRLRRGASRGLAAFRIPTAILARLHG
jgi:glycosyltransferase involved in cell wall biosynthesis